MNKMLFILFGIFLLAFTIFSYLFIDKNLIYLQNIYSGFTFQNRPFTTIAYASLIFIFFIFYFFFLSKLNKKRITLLDVKKLIFIAIFILLFAYPAMLSYDIFNYIFTAKVLFFYHENPYIIMPIKFVSDPLLLFTHAANKIALYGPVWVLITAIPYYIGNAFGFLSILFTFKFFIIPFYIGTAFLIWKMSKSLLSVYLFALNPLVVIETIVSGHNDIVMMFFVLLSLFLLSKNRFIFAGIFFILSIFIKYATLFLLPIFLYFLVKKIKRQEANWKNIFLSSAILMMGAFLLSPIREEIYPWYAMWFLPFTSLIPENKVLSYFSVSISFGLLFRYVPFMLLGTYSGSTPLVKSLVTFIPVILIFLFVFLKNKIWLRFSR